MQKLANQFPVTFLFSSRTACFLLPSPALDLAFIRMRILISLRDLAHQSLILPEVSG
jgi:hypothetical protein